MLTKSEIDLVEEIVDLAMEVGREDPIDFGMLSINEKDSYRLVAMGLMENKGLFDPEIGQNIMLASLTKCIVENMILNIQIHELKEKLSGKFKVH